MKDAMDPQLRKQQAGFRKNRSCTNQIATLQIILEQSLEWNSPLYINFVDYEKAFNSVDQQTRWKLLRHYRIPGKITNIIRNSYKGMTCRVVDGWQLTDAFEVRSEARMPAVASYVSSDDGLGHEGIYSPRMKWHPVDTLEAVG